MTRTTRTMQSDKLEAKLKVQLAQDAKRPSRRTRQPDGTILLRPSGFAVGLSIALEHATGEDNWAALDRLISELGTTIPQAPPIRPESLQAPTEVPKPLGPPQAPQIAPQGPLTQPPSTTWSFTMTGTITLEPGN
jgi:hypothetical protein